MAGPEFIFTLHLPEDSRFDDMLGDLANTVLRQAGYPERSIAAVADELRAGVATGRAPGAGCDVDFRAHAGELEIVVSQFGHRVYRTSRRLSLT